VADPPGSADDEGFDWLYGGAEQPQPRHPQAQQRQAGQPQQPLGVDPEPTRVVSTGQRPGGAGSSRVSGSAGGSGRRRRRWTRVVLLLVLAWVVFLVAVPVWAWSNIAKVDAQPAAHSPADTPGTTYLLVGSDSRKGLTKQERKKFATGNAAGQRTDTIILLYVPAGDGPTVLLSIPRDSYVDIPGHGMNKINAAFAFGGPRLLVRTVQHATHLRIDDYIELGFGGFVNIVDSVGGVRICPKTAMHDPRANLDIKAGCQHVNGITALGYVRSRYTDPLGDIGRAARQREVVRAVAGEAASPWTVLLPWRYFALVDSSASALTIGTNVSPLDLVKLGWAVSSIGRHGLTCAVPISSLGTSTSVGSVVTWNKPAAHRLFHAIATDQTSSIHCSATGTG
jgi:LCP family protein required for cell wall assembly